MTPLITKLASWLNQNVLWKHLFSIYELNSYDLFIKVLLFSLLYVSMVRILKTNLKMGF